MKFSVLMSVYYKENPEYFRQAVESVINQTVKPTEIVIIKDGKLSEGLEKVFAELINEYPQYIRTVPLTENVGLGLALQRGVLACRYGLIARMDTDDISKSNRFEKQLRVFVENPQISICGGYIEEFSNSLKEVDSIRRVPLDTKSIYTFAKKRNPFNHVTVMFKKDAVLKAGNYQPFNLLEDYYLWFRMIMKKESMKNLPEVLVSVRGGNDMMMRRGGWGYFKKEKKLFDEFLREKFINKKQYVYILIARLIGRLMPNALRKKAYYMIMR